jgi:hypothetical protein
VRLSLNVASIQRNDPAMLVADSPPIQCNAPFIALVLARLLLCNLTN